MSEREAFTLADLRRRRAESGRAYLEAIRSGQMSVGIYELPAGGVDRQSPHTEDEVYIVLEGRAVLRVGEQQHPVESGAVVFVEAGVEHRFERIEEDLSVVVVFAPAEGSAEPSPV